MDKAYWLSRKQASLKLARNAASSEARLVHYDLAGRYSVMAVAADSQATNPVGTMPPAIHAVHETSAVRDTDDA